MAVDAQGNLYIADRLNDRIREVSGGIITTVAGTGTADYSGDGGQATSAHLHRPTGVAVDAQGNLYIADLLNGRIREVSGGIISTVAGGGTSVGLGDGAGTLSRFARVLAASGDAEAAAEVFARAEMLHEETGAEVAGWLVFNTETRTMIQAQLDDAAYAAACERGRKLAADEAVALALDALA